MTISTNRYHFINRMMQRILAPLFGLTLLLPGVAHPEVTRSTVEPTPLMANETRLLVSLLEQAHFAGTAISDLGLDELLPKYMSDLDYNRLFFTEADRQRILNDYGPTLEFDLRGGRIHQAFEIFDLYRDRALGRIDWILERLEQDFTFDQDETFRPDRHELPWPANREAADELWEKRLKYELLADLLNDKELDEAKDNVRRRYERLRRTLLETDSHEVQEVFLSALSKLYDPHSSFLSANTLEDFSIQMRLSLVGIGAQLLSEDGYCTIKELIPGGPAALDGRLKPNDRIVAVAQENGEPVDVIDMKLRSAVELIRGEKGTTVHLTVIPADAADDSVRRTISLVRDEIRLTASRAKATIHEVPNENGTIVPIGVIEVPSFYGSVGTERPGETKTSTTDDVEELIGHLQEAGIEGLVLDLRRNGGGLLSEAIELTGLFIERGPVVQVKSSSGDLRVDLDRDPRIAYSGPLAILVSRNSASASEIVAGALQSYNRALVLGESSTHGKGTVQAIFELKNHLRGSRATPGAAKLTVQKFYLPDGQSTQNRGVIPDITFPSFNEYLPIGEADLPNALVWDTIPPGNWEEERDRFPVHSRLQASLIAELQKRSEKRQESFEEFQYLRRNIERFRERQEQKAVSLNLETRREQKTTDTQFREEMDAIKGDLATKAYAFSEYFLDEASASAGAETTSTDRESGDDLGEEAEAESESGIDIHLRESLRIVTDLVTLGHPIWAVTAQKAEPAK